MSAASEAFYTFLYLTRDTFSPWENLALLLQNYDKIDFQGLAPIVRDFYVFIPSWLWPGRPGVVLNSANYFTWEVLNNHSGLAISPTLIGSLVVMGGALVYSARGGSGGPDYQVVRLAVRELGNEPRPNRYKAAILHSFCFGAIFNMIVLAREGLDSFVSRVVFFMRCFRRLPVAGETAVLAVRQRRADQGQSDARPRAGVCASGERSFVRVMRTMEAKISVPQYELRGFSLWGWRDMQHALDFLFDGGRIKPGTLVAINAEKMLKAEEDNAEVKSLIEAAEFKYADGISVVRSIRKKYPEADVSRVAGADLWEQP